MEETVRPFIVNTGQCTRDGWDNPTRGKVSWFTLLSGDLTPSNALSAGIAEFEPRIGILKPHRHEPAEIYHILEGEGIVTLEGEDRTVKVGDTVFIPGNAEHGIRNESGSLLRFLYVFPTDRFSDVEYRFPEDSA